MKYSKLVILKNWIESASTAALFRLLGKAEAQKDVETIKLILAELEKRDY